VLDAVFSCLPPDLSSFEALHHELLGTAAVRCEAALEANTIEDLQRAIARAKAVGMEAVDVEPACTALAALEAAAEAAKRARRESLGLASVEVPDEFKCPITCDVMVDPVVASDGHSYERSAIEHIIRRGNKRSPLTRELLGVAVFPNVNLRKRMQQHEEEQEKVAHAAQEKAAETIVGSRKRPLNLCTDEDAASNKIKQEPLEAAAGGSVDLPPSAAAKRRHA